MKTGKELIVATKQYAVDNPAKSWRLFLTSLVLYALALTGTILDIPIAGQIACSILAGLLMVRVFVIYHDYEHRAILQGSKLAREFMTFCGMYCLAAPSVWRSSHDYHHHHNSKLRTAHIGSFPIMTKEAYEQCSRSDRMKYLFARHPLTILFGYFFIFFLGMCVFPFFRNPKRHFDCGVSLFMHLGVGFALTYYVGWQGLVLFLLVPHFIGSMLGSYLFYAQHNFPAASHQDKVGWTYEGAAMESSSFMKMNPLMSWFTANIGYHHIHHLNARIPFYRLPEVMEKMPEVGEPRTTSLNPLEVYRCLRLKVWDTEQEKMVRLN
ncbi:MAG: omega-6 fatty acid desaturase (delta-12 desaturase) [Limisphaerales bacterium]|jgi:omega-6 fatty acid desaturase (delta-12 desaturase)